LLELLSAAPQHEKAERPDIIFHIFDSARLACECFATSRPGALSMRAIACAPPLAIGQRRHRRADSMTTT
jgi:hypothetical protein